MANETITRATVANVLQTYIYRRALFPIAYAVPLTELASTYQLPTAGDTLRIPRIKQLSASTEASIDLKGTGATTLTIADSDANLNIQPITISFDEYVVDKYGLMSRINDWAKFTSLIQLAEVTSQALTQRMALDMNARAYFGLVGKPAATENYPSSLQFLRQDAEATQEIHGLVVDSATLTTIVNTVHAEADDFWNGARVTFTEGALAGVSRVVEDFTDSSATLDFTLAPWPTVPAVGDVYSIVGTQTTLAGDTIVLEDVYRTLERCRRYGAGSWGRGRPEFNVAKIRRDNSLDVAQGCMFLTTYVAQELKNSLSGSAANSDVFFQTSEGFRRSVGGSVQRIGGTTIVEVNNVQRCTVATGVFGETGIGIPAICLFKGAFGTTLLRDNPGNRQGLVVDVKMPGNNEISVAYRSIKTQIEMFCINKYFTLNALHGAVLLTGSDLA